MKVLFTIFKLFKNYKPLGFFSVIAMLVAALGLGFFIPVLIDFIKTGLVAKIPTLISCVMCFLISILSFFSGMILDTIKQKNRQDFEMLLHRTSDRFKELSNENKREIISYLFFGVLATVVNIVCYQFFGWLFGEEAYLINNVLSWFITVIFAFITNKLWVFKSESWSLKVMKVEVPSFLSARVFSLVLEETGLFLMIDLMKFSAFQMEVLSFEITGSLIAKVIMQFVVVVTNYIFSKFIIFKKK